MKPKTILKILSLLMLFGSAVANYLGDWNEALFLLGCAIYLQVSALERGG